MKEKILNVNGIDYVVREDGQIFSVYFKDKKTPIRQWLNSDGYACIKLGGSKKPGYKRTQKQYRVHRIVAKAFVPNPHNKPEVHHKDGNRTNNSVKNLQWVTHRENIIHSHESGNCNRKGEYNGRAKLTTEQVLAIRVLHKYHDMSIAEIARISGRGHSTILNIVHRYTWTHI